MENQSKRSIKQSCCRFTINFITMEIWPRILYCMHCYCTKLFHCKILVCLRKERLNIHTLFVDFLSTPAFLVPTPVPCNRIPCVLLIKGQLSLNCTSRVNKQEFWTNYWRRQLFIAIDNTNICLHPCVFQRKWNKIQ